MTFEKILNGSTEILYFIRFDHISNIGRLHPNNQKQLKLVDKKYFIKGGKILCPESQVINNVDLSCNDRNRIIFKLFEPHSFDFR